MKKPFTTIALFLSIAAASPFASQAEPMAFVIGQTDFPKGDSIEITSVDRSSDRMVVKGHYKLVSADQANLSFFITTKTTASVPFLPEQQVKISKGEGDFKLTHSHLVAGLPHISMYSPANGHAFAGVYFGNQEQAAEESKLDLSDSHGLTGGSSSTGSWSGPNAAILEYLGNPVATPANLDARYTAQGLTGAILHAAQDAGINVKNVVVDDSEFPPLAGVICGGSDFIKLGEQLKKAGGYEYNGGIGNNVNSDGSDTYNVFNLVPYHTYPAADSQTINHRLWLREQIFFDKITSQEGDLVPTHAQPRLSTMTIYLGDQTLDAELALTEKQQITGMMFRTDVQETDSMLFVLSAPQRASFWMKNCPEPLSAAYIGPDGSIEEIHHLEKNDTTPVDATNGNIQFVLETKDGWFTRHNVGVGTVISTAKGTLAQTFLPNME